MAKSLQNSLLIFILLFSCFSLKAQHAQFQTGDLFLTQGGGIIQWRDSNGVFIRNINTGDGIANGAGTGIRFHPLTGELWVTNQNTGNNTKGIRIIHQDGTPGNAINIYAYQKEPTSITFDKQGNAYVGGLWNDGQLVKINPSGTAILEHYTIPTDNFVYGPEWVEMDCNDSIIYYTFLEDRIKRYNVVTHQSLSNFAYLPGMSTWFFAMRLMPDSGMIVVSADNRILRLNAAGAIIQSYAPASPCGFFGLAATPDGKSFWVGGGAFYAPMYKFDIASGHVVDSFLASATQGPNVYGIAVYGDQLKNCISPDPDPEPIVIKNLNVYPNPGNGNLTLETDLTGKLTIRVFNKLGQPVFNREFNLTGTNNKIPLNLEKLSAGVYTVQAINNAGIGSQKIIIIH